MTNSTKLSTNNSSQTCAPAHLPRSDEAPMVITRLSGWIDFSEFKIAQANWIVRTRTRSSK